ncbi:hypothetical protein [Streptomyces sp. H23]|uniref:hypothetical protein n=1 Tax=Streptomyces sp. H23 TaxID=2541723 RepID=UPI00106E7158|nr:hypothetical protein [Streptomyces sp. H23]
MADRKRSCGYTAFFAVAREGRDHVLAVIVPVVDLLDDVLVLLEERTQHIDARSLDLATRANTCHGPLEV